MMTMMNGGNQKNYDELRETEFEESKYGERSRMSKEKISIEPPFHDDAHCANQKLSSVVL
eukprot:scaffold2325_cov126-Cylindrotheca_fusiformis.AAC.10